MARPSWHHYFLQIARTAATRGTCPRKQVGAVLVRDNQILAVGYNGSMRGWAHCDSAGCDMDDGHCVRTVHAEMNAIAQAARRGVSLDRALAYVTVTPCWNCFKVLNNAGITRILVGESYNPSVRIPPGHVELLPPPPPPTLAGDINRVE